MKELFLKAKTEKGIEDLIKLLDSLGMSTYNANVVKLEISEEEETDDQTTET